MTTQELELENAELKRRIAAAASRLSSKLTLYRGTKQDGTMDLNAWYMTNFTREQFMGNLSNAMEILNGVQQTPTIWNDEPDDDVVVKVNPTCARANLKAHVNAWTRNCDSAMVMTNKDWPEACEVCGRQQKEA